MSRTTLITNSYIFFFPSYTKFPFSFTFVYPSHLQYTSFRYLSCVEFLCVEVCAWTFPEKSEGDTNRRSTYPWEPLPGLGFGVLGGLWAVPGASCLHSAQSQQTPSMPFPGGNIQVPWRRGITLHCTCLVSCKINILLYIFREQQQKKCCYKVQKQRAVLTMLNSLGCCSTAFFFPPQRSSVCLTLKLLGCGTFL